MRFLFGVFGLVLAVFGIFTVSDVGFLMIVLGAVIMYISVAGDSDIN